METTNNSSPSSQQLQLPPGFRFHPTDEELVVHYLKKKAASAPLPVAIIAEINLYKFDPWELPDKAAFGEQEWYFFTPRDRKYPNGARPNRAATSGYWKATGIDKPVFTGGGREKVGVKKALVFYGGKPPKGVKTNWIMHEYRLTDNNNNNKSIFKPPDYDLAKNKGSLRLDDWVLCRIYKKSNMQRPAEGDGEGDGDDSVGGDLTKILASPLPCRSYNHHWFTRSTGGYNATVDNHENNNVLFNNMLNSNSGDNNHLHTTVVSTSNLFPASSSAYTKVFLTDGNPDSSPMAENDGSMRNLLSGIPLLQQQTMMLDPGESIFRQPYQLPDMNWYS